MVKQIRLWWKWRKISKSDYPLMYTGSKLKIRKTVLDYGTPLRKIVGPGGALNGARYLAPDGIERILHKRDTRLR